MAIDAVSRFYARILEILQTSQHTSYRHYDVIRTYSEMGDLANRQISALRRYRSQPIALYAGKSFETYTCIISILLSGNTWVPLSPETPGRRLAEMSALANIRAVVTDRELPDEVKHIVRDNGIDVIPIVDLGAGPADSEIGAAIDPDATAIIYFTSGSTGAPKGVALTHQNIVTVVNNIVELLPLRIGEVFADYHDLGFVISVPILFPCFLTESALVPATDKMDAFFPGGSLIENEVTVFITVPSTIARIRKAKRQLKGKLAIHVQIICGEPFHLDILEYLLDEMEVRNVYNFYGSTEVAPWVFYHPCRRADLTKYARYGFVPIGQSLPGTSVRVTEEDGELWVAGDNITPGYLAGANPEKFVESGGLRWFRTGDKVVWDGDVAICKGRLDSQIKIGGYRIELMDVESHLRTLSGVDGAICFTVGESAETLIVAVLHTQLDYRLADVRTHLAERVPAYMLPRRVFTASDLPFNKSGKIDRLAIRQKFATAVTGS